MQTGYDNYWMYQNSRPGPLHNLQNNNPYSNAVFTDSNRHVQNRRLPNHFNNCMQPPINVAYYHQNSQGKTSDFHQMPSSLYLEPFRPSNINDYQPRRASVNWSSKSGYLPQDSYTLENFSVRCLENHNKFSQGSSINKSNIRANPAPASSSIGQISRIRVKDVYSINNNNVSDSFLNKALLQTHSERQRENVINYGSNNYSAVDLNLQTKFVDNTYLAQSKLPPPYHKHTASKQPQQSCSQFGSSRQSMVASENNTLGFVPQEIHPDNYMLQRACVNEKPSEDADSGQLSSVQTYDQITRGIYNTSNNSQIQNCHQNELESTPYLETSNSSKSTYRAFEISNSNQVFTIPNCHENVSKSDSSILASYSSLKTPETNLNSQATSNPETSSYNLGQEGPLIKISIPHTGQSSFIRLNDSNSKSNSLNLSLPCLLGSNNECFSTVTTDRLSDNKINISECINSSVIQSNTRENTRNSPSTSVESHQNSSSPLLNNSSPLRKVVSPKQSFVNVNKESVKNLVSNSVPQNDLTSRTGGTNVSKVPISEKNIKLNLLTVKQEKSLTSAESLHEDDHSISGNNEHDRIITKEKIPVEVTLEDNSAQFSENLNPLEKSSPALEETGNSDSVEVRTFPKKPKDNPLEQTEFKSLGNSVSKGQRLKKKVRQRISYKSKINRVKLDMLIQFLRKDDELVQAGLKTPCEKTTTENIKCKKRKKHRIRKLSKTCIVRNKNISREMISLVSQKASRVDPSKFSFEMSDTVKCNVGSQKGKEDKEESAETGENIKNENSTSSENQPQKEDSSQLERNNKNEHVTREVQEFAYRCLTEEKDKEMINMMRILRTMTSNFCTNCKFSSSADSFWVNVVSFELRCLNCFKKFLPKEITTKNCGFDTGRQKVHSETERSLKDVDNSNSFSKYVNRDSKEIQHEKSNNLKEENFNAKLPENSLKERRESFERSKSNKSLKEGDMTNGRQNSGENSSLEKTRKKNSSPSNSIWEKSETKSSFSEEIADEISNKKSISKDQHADNRSRTLESECKNKKFLRSQSEKVEDKEDVLKKEKKKNVYTPKRKSSTESTLDKTSVTDECVRKEGKRVMNSREKERSTEQPKISKHAKPEMSEISQIPSKFKEISSTNDLKSKSGSSNSERKKCPKRKHSDDDPSLRKVYILGDHSSERKDVVQVTHSPDKTKPVTTTSKDVSQKTKPESENQLSKDSTNKSKSKDVISQKIESEDQNTEPMIK